ncbi:rhodanese-like domain-containing protein [Afifella sp. IM 167]|uniref:rhodanese-like domain-containing protein n=1 Tax=Afifella sp. IM 167 TaxID=2033586 RepID=UPI001CCD2C31
MHAGAYQGDVLPEDAWRALQENAVMIDVRTRAEWTFVGLPDLSSLGGRLVLAEWLSFPDNQTDPAFVDKLSGALDEAKVDKGTPLYFLCRSGVRSAFAAAAMSAAGFAPCFNVAGGFEGERDALGHRGHLNGWKAAGLPWSQS